MSAHGAVIAAAGLAMALAAALASALASGCWRGAPAPLEPPAAAAVAPSLPSGPIAPITCDDAGVILRRKVVDAEAAGPAKERAIAQACVTDRWPRGVIDCVGRGVPQCLMQLSPEQREAFNARLTQWTEAHPGEAFDELPVP